MGTGKTRGRPVLGPGPGPGSAGASSRFPFPRGLLPTLLSVTVLLVVWALAARAMDMELIFPGPLSTLSSTWTLLSEPVFWLGVGSSLVRVLVSFGLGLVICLPLGLLMGRHPFAWGFFQVWQVIFRSAPVISVILLALLWFPDAGHVAVFVSLLMVFPILLASIAQGRRSLDIHLDEMTRVFGFSPLRRFFWLILPWLKPFLLSSGKTALGIAWKVVAAAEVLAQPRYGLGSMMQEGRINLETSRVFALTLAIILLSALGDLVWEGLFRLLDSGNRQMKSSLHDHGESRAVQEESSGSTLESTGHNRASGGSKARIATPIEPVGLAAIMPLPDARPELVDLFPQLPSKITGMHSAVPSSGRIPSAALVSLESVSLSWEPDAPVLVNLSLDFASSSLSVLMGPSGKGKTTLARVVLGLIQPDEGRVNLAPGLVLAPAFQEHRLLPWGSVEKNALLAVPGRRQNPQMLEKLAGLLEIQDSLGSLPDKLSGGMRQRAALLRALYRGALAEGPVLYVLDEPFQSLDPALKARLLPELAPMLVKDGNAALVITHQAEDADLFGRNILAIKL